MSQHDKNIILQCAIGFTKNNDYVKYVEKFLIFSLLSLVLFVLVVVFFVISKSLSETKKILTEVENIKIDGKEIFFEKTGVSKEIDDLIVTFGNECFSPLIRQFSFPSMTYLMENPRNRTLPGYWAVVEKAITSPLVGMGTRGLCVSDR